MAKQIINNMFLLLESLFSTATSFVEEDQLVSKEFRTSFKTYEDKLILDNAVKELKDSPTNTSKKILLSSGESKTIVVM